MSDIVQYQQPIPLGEQMDFARAVVMVPKDENGRALGARSLLPEAYRENPGNVLLAVGLGSSMGLSPAESLYRIDVIQGKPTASAELIAANVRKAGHRLRVRGDENSCTATIIRADDPDFEFTVTRDVAWAQAMGLTGKDNYKKQRGTMLQWRAITAVARLACPEALYGVSYTPDEMYDDDRLVRPAPDSAPAGGLGAALGTTVAEQVDPEPAAAESPLLNTSSSLARRMFALFGEHGITDKDNRLLYVSDVVGREITSSKEMTDADAHAVIASLEADKQDAPEQVDDALPDPTDPDDPWKAGA